MPDYKVKTKPKKGAPLSAAQKQAIESGTFERKVEKVGTNIKKAFYSGVGASSKEPRQKLIAKPISKESNYKGTKTTGKTVRAGGAGGAGYCPTGTRNCKTAYSRSAKQTR
jgi:hypothetical protein